MYKDRKDIILLREIKEWKKKVKEEIKNSW